MKPYKILLFLLSIFTILAVMSYFFPKEGVEVLGVNLRFADFEKEMKSVENLAADLGAILNKQDKDTLEVVSIVSEPSDTVPAKDTLLPVPDTVTALAQKLYGPLKTSCIPIEFPDSSYGALASIFDAMESAQSNNKVVRILHYGDSQIEGDRLSRYLRQMLQVRFGGYGPGLLPALEINNYSNRVKHSQSSNWKRYSRKENNPEHSRFGPMTFFCRFNKSGKDDGKIKEGWIEYKRTSKAYSNVKKFYNCNLYYGSNESTVTAEVYADSKLLAIENMQSGSELDVLKWTFDSPPAEVKIKFTGKDSPDIYGITLDGKSGVAVDNIGLRGSSGLEFTKMDIGFLGDMYKKMNVKLVILQFGVNLVPIVKDDYTFYEESLYNQLIALKKADPELSILVVSVTDMSRKEGSEYVTYPNVEKIWTAQRNAALKAGCAFWDLYNSMGGKNSMPKWVFANPSLARMDFTHLNSNGIEIVSEMFYEAFINSYEEYTRKKKE